MHVVRKDPEQEGLLYAGTLQGAYVSFDQGKHWQSLQQNLPATPVTDIKVHHGDLVASTMGRSFWIMDDVAPLRQLAASLNKPSRPRTTDSPNPAQVERARADAIQDRILLAAAGGGLLTQPQTPAPATTPAARPAQSSARALPARTPIKPFDGSNVFLFTPAPAYRVHYN